jgi:uncharacterized protein YjlB
MEPLSSVMIIPVGNGLVARIHSSDFPVLCVYREVCAISIQPDGM